MAEMMELRSAERGKSDEALFAHAVERLLGDRREQVRESAIWLLREQYRLRHPDDPSYFQRGHMPAGLAALLLQVMKTDASEEVRRSAALALRYVSSLSLEAEFLDVLDGDPSVGVRDAARQYLVWTYGTGLPRNVDVWRRELRAQRARRDELIATLEARGLDRDCVDDIARHFVRVGDRRIVGPLLKVLTLPSVEPSLASRTMPIVSALADEEFVAELSMVLMDSRVGVAVRVGAATALGRIGTDECVDVLLQALEDEGVPVAIQAAAARGLGAHSADVVGAALIAAPAAGAAVGDQARRSLEALPPGPTIERLLMESLQHKSAAVRAGAARDIGRRRLAGGVDALLDLLDDESESVRKAVVRALRMWRDERIVRRLVEMYGKAPPELQVYILMTLAWQRHPEVIDMMKEAISDDDPTIRWAATQAIAELRPPEAYDLLSRALRDRSLTVRQAAIRGLPLLDDPRAFGLLLESTPATHRLSGAHRLVHEANEQLSRHASRINAATLLELVADPAPSTRRRASKLLISGEHTKAIGPLIDLLSQTDDTKTRATVGAVLRRLTRMSFTDTQVAQWKEWWEKHKDEFRD